MVVFGPSRPSGQRLAGAFSMAFACLVLSSADGRSARAQVQPQPPREFSVIARKYAFEPAVIEVSQGDIVRISFRTADIPHSFTVDAYRIAKRANPGHPAVFEFHASQPGTFPIYCGLAIDERCTDMHGELIVREK